MSAYYGSIECQKCGSLHLHLLLFIACMHQHNCLREIADMLRENIKLLPKFYKYKAHVHNEM